MYVLFHSRGDGFADIYVKPWTRIGPYIIGFLTGYILYKTECKIRIPKVLAFHQIIYTQFDDELNRFGLCEKSFLTIKVTSKQ